LTRLDHFEPDTSLEAAAEAVGRWFALLHTGLKVEGSSRIAIRDRKAEQMLAKGGPAKRPMRAEIAVMAHQGQFLALVCLAPASSWDELAADFDFLRRSLELSPQALAPTLQGPLARSKSGPTAGPAVTGMAPKQEVASPPAKPAGRQPIVRIP
ncbi:MAG TPA: hypothetical protein VFT55_07385, partial [Planctomycetota bacterium]|nr:hypothetical protein [Planctomycetota bacterium]